MWFQGPNGDDKTAQVELKVGDWFMALVVGCMAFGVVQPMLSLYLSMSLGRDRSLS